MKRAITLLFVFYLVIHLNSSILLAEELNTHEKIFTDSDYVIGLKVASLKKNKEDSPQYWDWSRLSGFIYEDENHKKWIITAGHGFINGSLNNIKAVLVFFRNGKLPSTTAKLVGCSKRLDVALLEFINEDEVRNVPSVKLGSSADLRVGQKLISIGFPSPFTKTQILTSGRLAAFLVGINKGLEYPELIVHECIINSGSSGSLLLNMKGEVVGVNIAFIAPSSSINEKKKEEEESTNNLSTSPFEPEKEGKAGGTDWRTVVQDKFSLSIPIDDIKRALPLLKKGGEVKYTPICLRFNHAGSFNDLELAGSGLTISLPQTGVMVTYAFGLAEKSGFQIGDVILNYDGKSVANQTLANLYRYIYLEADLTKKINFKVERKGVKVEIKMALSEKNTPHS